MRTDTTYRVNVAGHVLGIKRLDRLHFPIFIVQSDLLRSSAGGIKIEIVKWLYYESGVCRRENSIRKIASVGSMVHSEIEPKDANHVSHFALQGPNQCAAPTGPLDPEIPHQRTWQSQLLAL